MPSKSRVIAFMTDSQRVLVRALAHAQGGQKILSAQPRGEGMRFRLKLAEICNHRSLESEIPSPVVSAKSSIESLIEVGSNSEYPYLSSLVAVQFLHPLPIQRTNQHLYGQSPLLVRSTLPCQPHFWLWRSKSQEIGGCLRKRRQNNCFPRPKDIGSWVNGPAEWPNWVAKVRRGGSAPRGPPCQVNKFSPIAASIFAQTTSGHVGHPLPSD